MFNGKFHYKWPVSIAMLVHQRVTYNWSIAIGCSVSNVDQRLMFWAAFRTFVQGCGQNWAFRNAHWEYPPNKSGHRDILCVLPSGNLTIFYIYIYIYVYWKLPIYICFTELKDGDFPAMFVYQRVCSHWWMDIHGSVGIRRRNSTAQHSFISFVVV